MHYENTICYIVLSQNFHPLSLFYNEHLDKQFFSKIILWETLTKF
jgi:hypothetical protein